MFDNFITLIVRCHLFIISLLIFTMVHFEVISQWERTQMFLLFLYDMYVKQHVGNLYNTSYNEPYLVISLWSVKVCQFGGKKLCNVRNRNWFLDLIWVLSFAWNRLGFVSFEMYLKPMNEWEMVILCCLKPVCDY